MRSFSIIVFLLFSLSGLAAEVDTLAIDSKFLKSTNKSVIVLPDSYANDRVNYPVVYLLHGYSGKYDNWIKLVPSIKQLADKYKMIIVCPDGGYAGWYLDSPLVPENQYESFFVNELVPHIDSNYRTISDRKGRIITGLSMGGHGALILAIRNSELFGITGSMSGVLDITIIDRYELENLTGGKDSKTRNEYSAVMQASNIKDLKIIIDCGKDDHLVEHTVKMHNKLNELDIEHDYIMRPGKHNWKYWANAIEYQFLFFHKNL